MDAPVYVVGHRHPDTDSIASAIGYARLKNALGDARVRPARAGELTARRAGCSSASRCRRPSY